MARTLTPAFVAVANGSTFDEGLPLDLMHPFRSDISADGSKVVVLGSVASLQQGKRQMVVKVFSAADGRVVQYVFPRTALFNRLDVSGSQRGNVSGAEYPAAFLLEWDAVDVVLSADATSIFIIFNCTYDFVARCSGNAEELGSADCHAYGGPIQLKSATTVYKGCVVAGNQQLACLYESSSRVHVTVLNQTARFVLQALSYLLHFPKK